MTAKVIDFPGSTVLPVPVPKVLGGALEANLERVVVIGIQADGAFYIAGSEGTAAEALLTMERARRRLIDSIEEGEAMGRE